MAMRVMQVTLPKEQDVQRFLDSEVVQKRRLLGMWNDCRDAKGQMFQIAVPAESTEEMMDELEEHFGDAEGFSVALFPVQALLPRPSEVEEEGLDEAEDEDSGALPRLIAGLRVSREELYHDLTEGLDLSFPFLAMVGISAVVGAVGLLQNDLAVVIGAMVIAPLLRPNIALSLAVTLFDVKLALRAVKAGLGGYALAIGLAALLGLLFPVDPSIEAIAGRSSVDLADLPVALAAGAAGTLAFTQGLPGPVIGVMVSVALLPPLVATGLLLGAGQFEAALGALLLTLANIVSINLAGVSTFLVQGVKPRSWYEAKKARRATWAALATWAVLLAGLTAIVLLT